MRPQTVVSFFCGSLVSRPTEPLGIRKLHFLWSDVSERARIEIGGYPSVDFTARSLERHARQLRLPSHS